MNRVSYRHLLRLSMLIAAALLFFVPASFAQGLNWEGQTGAFITPFAYTTASPANGIGHPTVALHYLNTGEVIGNSVQLSGTVGLFKRVEVGYTRALNSSGDTQLSPLFDSGFNTFHGKLNFISENAFHTQFPAISVGFVARTQVRRVGGVLTGRDTSNGDIYLVATKTIKAIKGLPILVNAGVKGTNASIFGIAGNAPDWEARSFGAAGLVLPGPAKSKIVVGSEFAQQPHHIQDLPGATVPTTLTYFARLLPFPEKPLNFDFGVAQAASRVLPTADVKARAQFAIGISYRL